VPACPARVKAIHTHARGISFTISYLYNGAPLATASVT
jgi:hypothetical protein